MSETTFIGDFKRAFLTGLAALFPILITVFLLSWLYQQLDRTIGVAVNGACRQVIASRPRLFETAFPGAPREVVADPEARAAYAEECFPGFVGVSIGILGALVIIYLIGVFLRGYVGGKAMGVVHRFFERFPVIKAIYPHARQVAEFLFGAQRGGRFRRVVAVPYPRQGIYTVGFLTGGGLKDLEAKTGKDLVTVFVPTSPAPLTGFVIAVPREDVTEMDMSVEETFRFCMSAGMVAPARQRPEDEDGWRPSAERAVPVGAAPRRGVLDKPVDRSTQEE